MVAAVFCCKSGVGKLLYSFTWAIMLTPSHGPWRGYSNCFTSFIFPEAPGTLVGNGVEQHHVNQVGRALPWHSAETWATIQVVVYSNWIRIDLYLCVFSIDLCKIRFKGSFYHMGSGFFQKPDRRTRTHPQDLLRPTGARVRHKSGRQIQISRWPCRQLNVTNSERLELDRFHWPPFSGKGCEVACIKFQLASGANPGKTWLYRRNIGGTTAMWEHVAGFKGGCQHVLGRKQWKKWHRSAAIVSRRWFTGFVAPGVLGCQNMVQCM